MRRNLTSVDLPVPFGPIRPIFSPGWMAKLSAARVTFWARLGARFSAVTSDRAAPV